MEIAFAPIFIRLNPKERREAARRAAAIVWGKIISGGRPKGTGRWNRDAQVKLGARLREIELENSHIRRTSYSILAEQIKSRWPEDYQHDEPSNLRKRLPEARRVFEKFSGKKAKAARRRPPLSR